MTPGHVGSLRQVPKVGVRIAPGAETPTYVLIQPWKTGLPRLSRQVASEPKTTVATFLFHTVTMLILCMQQ